jgi:WD40 repeat protein
MASAGFLDQTVRIWDTETGEPIRVLPVPELPWHVAFSPDARVLAASCSGQIVRWRTDTWQRQPPLLAGAEFVANITFSPDGSLLVCGTKTGHLMVWETRSSKRLVTLPLPGEKLAFSPDGRRLAVCRDMSSDIHLIDPRTGQQLGVIRDHDAHVQGLAFSPDGRALASADSAGVIRVRVADRMPLP